jgi:hypothetical protein
MKSGFYTSNQRLLSRALLRINIEMPANIDLVAWKNAVMSSSMLPTCANPEDHLATHGVTLQHPEMDLGSRGRSGIRKHRPARTPGPTIIS